MVKKKSNPQKIHIDTCCEICSVIIHCTSEIVLISVYKPPATSICQFTNEMSKVLSLFEEMNVCVMGDFNEDLLVSDSRNVVWCSNPKDTNNMLKKLTRDSGTLIDHIYAMPGLHVTTDVCDCYYSDHDYVLCTMKTLLYFYTTQHYNDKLKHMLN